MGYVCMTDKAMSGWGPCRGKLNLYVIQCDTAAQMEQILRRAATLPEMVRIHTRNTKPQNTRARVVTLRHFDQVTGWHR